MHFRLLKMKKTIQTIILILAANGLLAQTNISAGNVSGTWNYTSPYKITVKETNKISRIKSIRKFKGYWIF